MIIFTSIILVCMLLAWIPVYRIAMEIVVSDDSRLAKLATVSMVIYALLIIGLMYYLKYLTNE